MNGTDLNSQPSNSQTGHLHTNAHIKSGNQNFQMFYYPNSLPGMSGPAQNQTNHVPPPGSGNNQSQNPQNNANYYQYGFFPNVFPSYMNGGAPGLDGNPNMMGAQGVIPPELYYGFNGAAFNGPINMNSSPSQQQQHFLNQFTHNQFYNSLNQSQQENY